MHPIHIIENSINFRKAFKSFSILDSIDEIDHPEMFKFATIISNYLDMQEMLKKQK